MQILKKELYKTVGAFALSKCNMYIDIDSIV